MHQYSKSQEVGKTTFQRSWGLAVPVCGDGATAACAVAEGSAAKDASAGSALVAVTSDPTSKPVVEVHRFSTLTRAVRIMGLVLKFIRLFMCRSATARRKIGVGVVLSGSEMRAAQSCMVCTTRHRFTSRSMVLSVGVGCRTN